MLPVSVHLVTHLVVLLLCIPAVAPFITSVIAVLSSIPLFRGKGTGLL